jgi:KDO2-lipid IV(A) lauroyltransferase
MKWNSPSLESLKRWHNIVRTSSHIWHIAVVAVLRLFPFRLVVPLLQHISTCLYASLWRPDRTDVVTFVEAALGESGDRARAIAIASFRTSIRFWADYALLAYGDDGYAARRVREIRIPDPSVFEYLRETNRPILLTSLHMGNYLSGFNLLLEAIGEHRPFAVFRILEGSEIEDRAYRHFRKRVKEFHVFRQTGRSSMKALAHLRRGGMAAIFVDLPRSFGPTRVVSLFDHPSDLVAGPAVLALAARCVIAPVFMGRDEAGNEILVCEPPFEAVQQGGETRDEALDRIMRHLTLFIERAVRDHPEQWLMWPDLPGFIA